MEFFRECKHIMIGILLINLLLGMCQILPVSLVKVDCVTSYNGDVKLYLHSDNELESYSEKNTVISRQRNTMQFFATESQEKKLRIDFEADKGEVGIPQIKVFKPLTISTLNSDNLKNRIIREQGVIGYKDGKFSFEHNDAWIIVSNIRGDWRVNVYTICLEVILLMIAVVGRFFYGRVASVCKEFVLKISLIVDYYKTNNWILYWIIFLLLMAYGFKIFNFSCSIDTEYAILRDDHTAWIKDGRFGVDLLILFLNLSPHVPYVSNFLAVVFLGIAAFVWNYTIFGESNGTNKILDGIFCGAFVTCPSLAEMMNFSTYNFEVTVGLVICGLAVLFFTDWVKFRKKDSFVYVVLLLVMSIGIYQSMIILFVMGICMNRLVINEEGDDVLLGHFIKACLICSVCALILYQFICKILYIFIPRWEYLDGFVRYGKDSNEVIIKRFLEYLYDIISGEIYYGMGALTFGFVIVISYLIYEIITRRVAWKRRCLYLCCIIFSLFIFQFLTGGTLPVRANLMLAMFVSFIFTFGLLKVKMSEKIFKLSICFCLVISFYQAYTVSFLMHGEYIKSQHEFYMINNLAGDLLQVEYEAENKFGKKLPVAIIGGSKDTFPARAVHKGEIIGHSIMGFKEPGRIFAYMRILGYDFKTIDKKEYEQILKEYKDRLPEYPVKESIVVTEKCIIVSL